MSRWTKAALYLMAGLLLAPAIASAQAIVINRDGGYVTPEQVAQIRSIPTGCPRMRAGIVRALGLPFRQLPATRQSDVVYEYRLRGNGDQNTRLVLGASSDGCYTGYGFRYGYESYNDLSLK